MTQYVGKVFGRWTVLRHAGSNKSGRRMFDCRCKCGVERTVLLANLVRGVSGSCGCLKSELTTARNSSHMNSKRGQFSGSYVSWASMVQRCTNPKRERWKNYGGRGIAVCGRWMQFENFLADMGERADGTTLDRIDVNGDYEPGNCRWATDDQQRANRRRIGQGSRQQPCRICGNHPHARGLCNAHYRRELREERSHA